MNPTSHATCDHRKKRDAFSAFFTRTERRNLRRAQIAVLLLAVIVLAAGCSCNRTRVVLLPDPDNHVGKVEVANAHGSTLIDQSGYGVTLKQQSAPPPAVPIDEEKIRKDFASVLAEEPETPAKFILHFKSDSDMLTDSSRARIPEIVAEIEKRNSMDIGVAGHSDRVGDEGYNIELSFKRARQVSTLLQKQGVDARFIHTSSHGEGNPLIPTPDNVPEPRNRRVEVTVR